MEAYQYDHFQGSKLTQRQLDDRKENGWEVMEHFCSADDVHSYVFKRKKQHEHST